MSNPLLTFTDLPPFSQIKPEHIKPAVEQAIADCRAKVEAVLKESTHPTLGKHHCNRWKKQMTV
ncbi:hypothetical protein P4S64_22485 [Vibrio sp. M60_M31a]